MTARRYAGRRPPRGRPRRAVEAPDRHHIPEPPNGDDRGCFGRSSSPSSTPAPPQRGGTGRSSSTPGTSSASSAAGSSTVCRRDRLRSLIAHLRGRRRGEEPPLAIRSGAVAVLHRRRRAVCRRGRQRFAPLHRVGSWRARGDNGRANSRTTGANGQYRRRRVAGTARFSSVSCSSRRAVDGPVPTPTGTSRVDRRENKGGSIALFRSCTGCR